MFDIEVCTCTTKGGGKDTIILFLVYGSGGNAPKYARLQENYITNINSFVKGELQLEKSLFFYDFI